MNDTIPTDLSSFKQLFPIVISEKVRWGDMDALQHVNNTVYFRYFECVRMQLINHINHELGTQGIHAILAETQCQFLHALTFPDTIHIGLKITHIGNSACLHTYAIYSEKQRRVTTLGSARMVQIDQQTQTKTAMPEDLKLLLKKLIVDTE